MPRLNKAQREVVKHDKGPLLIIAGAGSGKTTVIVKKIAYLIQKGIDPYSILAVAFSRKAAREIKERVEKLVKKEVWIRTFHSTCLQILKSNIQELGFPPDFSICDEDEQLSLLREIAITGEDKIIESINRAKDNLIGPASYKKKHDEVIRAIYEEYQKKLNQNNALDFGDLIMFTVELFKRKKAILESYQDRFKYILVDEAHDINKAQYTFLKRLAWRDKNITIVGDPDQAIYGWRGASLKNILRFEKDFKPHVITLERNYRSTKNILEVSNALIEHNRNRKEKILWTNAEKGDLLTWFEAASEDEEALFICREIKSLERDGWKFRDIVILYRTHALFPVIENVLLRERIPYEVIGRERFYDQEEIRSLVNILKVISGKNKGHNLPRIEDEHLKELINGLNPDEKASKILNLILKETSYLEGLERTRSVSNIRRLILEAKRFERESSDPSLSGFLDYIAPFSDINIWNRQKNAVTLMTLHSSKGLEFPVVFIPGLEESILPHHNCSISEEELEEERRLAYVGLTRAKKKIYLTSARHRSIRQEENMPSRFLAEIPEHLLVPGLPVSLLHEESFWSHVFNNLSSKLRKKGR